MLNPLFHNGERNGKVIWNPYAGLDHHRKLITSRGSSLAHAYHVSLTSITAIMSYRAHRMIEQPITLLHQPCRRNNTVFEYLQLKIEIASLM